MIGQQQAQSRFDLRSESQQQAAATTFGKQAQSHPTEGNAFADADREIAVVAELGYN